MDDNEQTTDVQTPRAVETTPPETGQTAAGGDMAKVRELVLKAHPDVVPDLVQGGSVDELIASVEPARSAYQRIADQVREVRCREVERASSREERDDSSTSRLHDSSTPSLLQPPPVPAGAATNVVDPGDLAPTSKIARALAERKRRG